MQTTILNILDVVIIWCGWHMQVLCNFIKMLTWAWYETFVTVVERKGCHGNDNRNGVTTTTTEMVPRQHSDDPTTHWDTDAKEQVCGCAEHAKDGGAILVIGHGKRGGMWTTTRTLCKHEHLIPQKYSFSDDRLGVIPSKRVFSKPVEFDVV